jgi:predicted NBD/HSP70 family sugar kinase
MAKKLITRNILKALQLVRAQESISRSQVGEKLGASPFLVSQICDALLGAGFITEAGLGDSTGGRRPTLLSLRKGFGRIVGVHFGSFNVRIALTDFGGTLIEYLKDESKASHGPEVALHHLFQLIDRVLEKAGIGYSELDGIGIGVSGVLDRSTGQILFWPKLPLWVNVPIKHMLEERYKTLVELDDTSRTRAYAESRLGGAGWANHFVYISSGAGVGAALFLNGQLYSGAAGFAGEFGHMTVSEEGPLCSCGNRGCLETMVSAWTLIRKARQGLDDGLSNTLKKMTQDSPESLSVEMIAKAARNGDRFSRRLLSEAGMYLGRGIVGLVNLLNPELIVIGAAMASAAGDLLLPEIERVVQDRAMILGEHQVKIQISKLDEKEWAIGASFQVAEKALINAFLRFQEKKKRIVRSPAVRSSKDDL